jgi:hypothetical protein
VFSNDGLNISIVYISVMKRESKLNLNSDDQQFHKYENDDKSPLTSTNLPLQKLLSLIKL